MERTQPRLYTELASWFHLLTAPADYAGEAAFYLDALTRALGAPPRTLLELGSGGGNNASHYKAHVQATLTDRSPDMLALSRTINPECEHIEGDMRTLRLGRTFDAVLVHDAVMYLTTEAELRQAVETAFAHTRPGGAALFAPDFVRETFRPATSHGGHDGDGRALRYLEWVTDPDPTDSRVVAEFVYLLHEDGRPSRVEHDAHHFGVFPRASWLGLLTDAGFTVSVEPLILDGEPYGESEVFVCRRR